MDSTLSNTLQNPVCYNLFTHVQKWDYFLTAIVLPLVKKSIFGNLIYFIIMSDKTEWLQFDSLREYGPEDNQH